ncbi:capsule polysaccharide biosynthesis domain protein [Leptospira fainei serovar Hurstbridge str. BUT 6]|uniref:Capsule polysaccharide biosynthesis domain protein n=1 Tax=Leptospira fainei serovar Hurstbridge str. BUT 6 TaxID=1193011 RepID=S3W7Q5_9LEPT|nr:capsule polysaccharide biosynthesis domain protein [Leptospira fainei serovar Hurstbridge str. BUT 6]
MIFETNRVALNVETQYYACAVLSHEYSYSTPEDELLPVGADLLRDLSDCEGVVLKMMERDEIRGEWSYNKRKSVYLKHLRYWNHVIETDDIGYFLSSNIPHVVYDYIIYSLCIRKGIPTIFFYQFQPGLSFFMRDWKDPTPGIVKLFERRSAEKNLNLSDRMEREWQTYAVSAENKKPFYMMNSIPDLLNEPSLNKISLLRRLVRVIFFKPWRLIGFLFTFRRKLHNYLSLFQRMLDQKRIMQIDNFYRSRCVDPVPNEKYIYLPLHLQPEMSTSPMAGVFVDQVLIAQMLNAYLPKNCYIYIKEHPNQDLKYRDESFYGTLASLKSVRLISRDYDTFELIQGCTAVATCTGTAGWEALLKGKIVLLFGYTFYQDAPGVFKIRSVEDCRDALHRIFDSSLSINVDRIRPFLKALEDYAFFGNIDPDYMLDGEIDWQSNIDRICKSIDRLLISNHS